MVALAPNTSETSTWDVLDGFPKLHSRAREVKTARCTEAPASKSFGRVEIWLMISESCVGLESFTRDPIGFAGSKWDLYEYVDGRSLSLVDASGLCGGPADEKLNCYNNCAISFGVCLATTGIMCWRCITTCAWFPPPWNAVCLGACAASCAIATGVCFYSDYLCNQRCDKIVVPRPVPPLPPPSFPPEHSIA